MGNAVRTAALWVLALWLALGASALAQTGAGAAAALSERMPLQVAVGIEIDQITFVDQKSENFGAVATIRMRWNDPALAFDADEYGDPVKVMAPEEFYAMAEAIPTPAPIFVVQNQQERRWVQTALVTVEADGDAFYAERSSVKLQAPYFNFRRYPFDHQVFFYEVRSVVPDTFIELTPMAELWGFGDLLGEEEWILENPRLIASVEPGLTGQESSQVALRFEGRRHIEYYALRLFLPLLVLIVVAWATFFLEQYQRRIEIAGANLLVFVAFNFAISDSLPRLGYTTFLDFILQWMFLVTGAVIVVNVALRRLEIDGHEALARRIDNWVIKWIYPLGYAAIIGFAVYSFLLN
jgi:hypothetical protein